MDVSVGHVLKGLLYLHFNPLAAQGYVFSGSGTGDLSIYDKGILAMLE